MSSAASAAISEEQDDERYYRIGEVSRLTGVPSFVLRYWEGEFPMLQPAKSPQGYRLYRQQDVDLVLKIKHLLEDEGFTIAGACRHLQQAENGSAAAVPLVEDSPAGSEPEVKKNAVAINRDELLELRDALRSFLTTLERK
jgi:DNA-binding transcriptional MerR regulator